MNRRPLNGATLGRGVSTLEKYWGSVVNVTVAITAEFTRYAHVASDTIVEVATETNSILYSHIQGVINLVVDITAEASVGVQYLWESTVVTGMTAVVDFTRIQYFVVSQTVRNLITAGFGYVQYILGNQPVEVTTVAPPSIFGEYADDARQIIVPQVDSSVAVDAAERDTSVDGAIGMIIVPQDDRNSGVT